MPDIAAELIAYLKTKTAITDLVGSGTSARIYQDVAKQTVPSPFIIFQVFTLLSEEDLGGISGLAGNRIELNCYANSSSEVYTLADAVRYAPLQGFRGQMGGAFVTAVISDGGSDRDFDAPVQGGNQLRYYDSRDYFIYYMEPAGV